MIMVYRFAVNGAHEPHVLAMPPFAKFRCPNEICCVRFDAQQNFKKQTKTNKQMKVIVYVLHYDARSLAAANELAAAHPAWARPLALKQTHLLENVMYAEMLAEREFEWIDADFVGTISALTAPQKIPAFNDVLELLDLMAHTAPFADSRGADIMFFFVKHSPFFMGHPHDMAMMFDETCAKLHLTPQDRIKKWGFANYWISTPAFMKKFVAFFATEWLVAIESDSRVWNDSLYYAGSTHPAVLSGVTLRPYLSYHTFISERVVNAFAASCGANCRYWEASTVYQMLH
jgi:hypothetical protein